MPVITALWARSAVASSAIIWRTKRRKSSRRARRTLHPLLLPRAPTDRRARASRLVVERGFGLRIERPAWPSRSVEPVDHAEPQALNARPSDHRAIVGAKLGRRRDEGQSGLGAQLGQSLAQRCIGRDSASNHHRAWSYADSPAEQF